MKVDQRHFTEGPSPWVSMWLHPRQTIERSAHARPRPSRTLVSMLLGISLMLGQMSSSGLGDRLIFPLILILGFGGGPIVGVLAVQWVGSLLHWVGSRLKGSATVDEVRSAYAWAWVPTAPMLMLWLAAIMIFGPELFTTKVPNILGSPTREAVFLGFALILLIGGGWSLVLLVAALSEVEHFSTGRALATVALSSTIVFALAIVISILASLASGFHSVRV